MTIGACGAAPSVGIYTIPAATADTPELGQTVTLGATVADSNDAACGTSDATRLRYLRIVGEGIR